MELWQRIGLGIIVAVMGCSIIWRICLAMTTRVPPGNEWDDVDE